MATPSLEEAEFLFGACEVCGKRVLTYTDFGLDGAELRRCLHCETEVTDSLQATPASELQGSGYVVVEARACGDGGGCSAGTCGLAKR